MNIAEILKDAPRGTKLYSPIFGDVLLNKVNKFNIEVLDIANNIQHFIYTGLYNINGECMLFPSRENRDWSTFKFFKKGDILISKHGKPFIFKELEGNKYKSYCGIDTSDIFWKDSDNWTTLEVRKATEQEIALFFERLGKEGFKWNSNTLTLEKLENRFDINTLKSFDKVLVRDSAIYKWTCNFYSHYRIDIDHYKYACMFDSYHQCIPYNDETKHLVGTDKDCPDYYKTW